MTQIAAAWTGSTTVSKRISKAVRELLPTFERRPRRRRSFVDQTTELILR